MIDLVFRAYSRKRWLTVATARGIYDATMKEVEQLMQSHISAKNAAGTGADGLLAYSI